MTFERRSKWTGIALSLCGLAMISGTGCANGQPQMSCGATIPRPSSAAVEELAASLPPGQDAATWIAEIDRAIDAQDDCVKRRGR